MSKKKNQSHDHLTRMTIDIPSDEHKRLKTLAAAMGKSMREIVAEWIHINLCNERAFNAETLKAIEDLESGKNILEAKDAQDLFRKLGI